MDRKSKLERRYDTGVSGEADLVEFKNLRSSAD